MAPTVLLPAGVSSGHTTTYRNRNPVSEVFTAPSQAPPCPCRGDGWERGFFFRHTKKHQNITAKQPASSKHLARITRRKSPGLLPLIGPTFSGAAFHQPLSAKNHESDLQEGEKKGKIGFKSVAGLGLVSAASQPRAGRDPAHRKGQQEGVGYTRPSPSIRIFPTPSPEHPLL